MVEDEAVGFPSVGELADHLTAAGHEVVLVRDVGLKSRRPAYRVMRPDSTLGRAGERTNIGEWS